MSEQKKKNNVVVLIIIIVLVVTIGGYAVFDTQSKSDSTAEITTTLQITATTTPETTITETTVQATTENYKAKYLELINDYENRYGEARYSSDNYSNSIVGFCYAELIDFNNDGIDELLLLYNDDSDANSYNYEIWTYKDGSLKNVDSGEPFNDYNNIFSVITATVNSKKYYVTGNSTNGFYMDGNYYPGTEFYKFREFKQDKFVEVKSSDKSDEKWTKNLEMFSFYDNVSECKGKVKMAKNNCK